MNKKIAAVVCALALVAAGAYFIIRYQAEKAARRQVESVAFRIPDVEAIDYDSARIDWQASTAHIKEVTVSLKNPAETIRIDEVLVHDGDLRHDVPDRLDVEIRGVRLRSSQPRLEKWRPYLEKARYEQVAFNLRCTYRYHRSRHVLEIETLEIEADDAGRLTFNARFNNINLPRLLKHLTDKAYLITALPAVSVTQAELSYADDTLARRLLAAWAQGTGQTPREVGQELNRILDRELGQDSQPISREALAGLKAFISDPETLRITAAPPTPVSFFRFLWVRQPSDVIELLNIRVTD
jgi:hypothetical protein